MFSEIKKEEILSILKNRNFSEEKAEEILEMLAEGLGDSLLDIVELLVSKLENEAAKSVAGMMFAAVEPKAREAVDKIEIKL